MDLEKIDGIKVFIIESLHENDKRTGENLKDNLRQIWYDQGLLSYFTCQYNYVSNSEELYCVFAEIGKQVSSNNRFPIIQIECHGCLEGLELESYEKVCWGSLFDHLRPINEASCNFLFLNLSMCFGEAVIRYIDPTKRAPFRGVAGPIGKVFPETLEKAWLYFYEHFYESLKQDYAFPKLSLSSGLIYYSQDFIFDCYYDLANKDPEMFESLRKRELYELFLKEGPLAIDPKMHSLWIAEKQALIKKKYRAYFCFDDLLQLHKEIYRKTNGSYIYLNV